MEAKPMKGISCCGDCGYYNWKKHKCSRFCKDEGDPRFPFYCDCPLPDVVEQNPQKWIPVTERLPDNSRNDVLVCIDHGNWKEVTTAFLGSTKKWYHDIGEESEKPITHWMPLPEPPKGEESE